MRRARGAELLLAPLPEVEEAVGAVGPAGRRHKVVRLLDDATGPGGSGRYDLDRRILI